MTKLRKSLLAGAVIAAFASGYAYSQAITSRTLTGLESWAVGIGGPQGPSIFITTAQVRNSTAVLPTALTSGTLTLTTSTSTVISTAASVSLTINLPPTPYDGQIFEWINGSGGAFTAGTVAVTDGSTIVNGSAMGTAAAGVSKEWRYSLANNSWYAMR